MEEPFSLKAELDLLRPKLIAAANDVTSRWLFPKSQGACGEVVCALACAIHEHFPEAKFLFGRVSSKTGKSWIHQQLYVSYRGQCVLIDIPDHHYQVRIGPLRWGPRSERTPLVPDYLVILSTETPCVEPDIFDDHTRYMLAPLLPEKEVDCFAPRASSKLTKAKRKK